MKRPVVKADKAAKLIAHAADSLVDMLLHNDCPREEIGAAYANIYFGPEPTWVRHPHPQDFPTMGEYQAALKNFEEAAKAHSEWESAVYGEDIPLEFTLRVARTAVAQLSSTVKSNKEKEKRAAARKKVKR